MDDVTPLILFLADDTISRFIVGQTFFVDGGQSIDGVIDAMIESWTPFFDSQDPKGDAVMGKNHEDMRSYFEFGEASECRRGLMLGMGYH